MHNEWADKFTDEVLFFMIYRFLFFILNNENINENDICSGCKNVPTIWYNDENGKKHRHYVDIYLNFNFQR